MTTLVTTLQTWFSGRRIGTDVFGNKYYESRKKTSHGRKRRWVVYQGIAEPSKVPGEWHGWLHYTHDNVPDSAATKRGWQKEHLPNLTGTTLAYVPPGHVTRGGKRDKSASDYQAWVP